MPPESLHFVAGWDRGEYIFHSVAAEIHPAPGHDPLRKSTVHAVVYDWALIVLEDDPSPTTGIVRPAAYTEDIFWKLRKAKTVFTQAGYSGDRGQVLTAHPACLMLGFTKGLKIAEYQCQAVPSRSRRQWLAYRVFGWKRIPIGGGARCPHKESPWRQRVCGAELIISKNA